MICIWGKIKEMKWLNMDAKFRNYEINLVKLGFTTVSLTLHIKQSFFFPHPRIYQMKDRLNE